MRAGVVVAALLFAGPALARSDCADLSVPKSAIAAHDGKWAEVTPEQYRFLEGIYAMDPATPPGLPYGDRAVLATADGMKGGIIFWIDGDRACTPMPIPPELIEMMNDVAAGAISHEAGGL